MTRAPKPEPNGPRKPSLVARRWFWVALALVVGWVALLVLSRGATTQDPREFNPPILEAPTGPKRTDYAWKLLDLDDATVGFDRFKGRPVLLNIWATWCPPCVEELPSIARLAADPRIKASGAEIVCVSSDTSAEAVRRFLDGKGWTMTILRATDVPPEFYSLGIPSTFLIAADGRIVATHLGPARWDDPSVISTLQTLGTSR